MILTLPWPPSNNHYYTVARGRKILSAAGRKYLADAKVHILAQNWRPPRKPLTGRLVVQIVAYPPDKRARDLDNLLKPILDSCQGGGLFENDSQIDNLRIRRDEQIITGAITVEITELAADAVKK